MNDLLSVVTGIICHQVNCQGVMGAGLAKALKEKYPSIFPSYQKYCKLGQFRPGMVQFCRVADQLYVCNMAGQDRYGTRTRQTDYDALASCLAKLHTKSVEIGLTPYIPFKMGCGLAGGNWSIVSQLIKQHCPNAVILTKR